MSEPAESDHMEPTPSAASAPRARASWPQLLTQLAIGIALVVTAVLIADYFMSTKPRTERRKRKRGATLVEVEPIKSSTQQAVLELAGTVTPAREIAVYARVSGEIVAANPELLPGGVLTRGAEIVRIDAMDYQLAIAQASSSLAQARANVQLEQGNQAVARDEYALLQKTRTLVGKADKSLVLREPQLAVAKASVAAARANLRRAQVDLSRTRVRAPFDAIVRARSVDVGSRVTPTTPLATLAGIDTWWVEVAMPRAQLRWLDIPSSAGGSGSRARIYDESWLEDGYREGHVIRVAPDVEERGRLARVLIAIPDPQARKPANAGKPRLLLGSWVRVEVFTKQMANVVALASSSVHDGAHVWVMTKAGTLDIRKVSIAFRGKDKVYVNKGLSDGEQVVVTNLAGPVPGMALRTRKRGRGQTAGAGQPR